jgi:hypothetical protein
MSIETKPTIQQRMQTKAHRALDEVEAQIDKLMDEKKTSFSMYNYLTKLEYSGKVVKFMKGFTQDIVYEIKNEESCDQLEEAYNFLNSKQKAKVIKQLELFEKDIDKYVSEYKPIKKPRKPKSPKQLVSKLPFLKQHGKYHSVDPEEIIRARYLFTYNVASKKFTKFETYGGLNVKGSRIVDFDVCEEKTLTDMKLLDRIYKGGNIIAKNFMDEIPRSKLKEGNNLLTKNTLLIKVIR